MAAISGSALSGPAGVPLVGITLRARPGLPLPGPAWPSRPKEGARPGHGTATALASLFSAGWLCWLCCGLPVLVGLSASGPGRAGSLTQRDEYYTVEESGETSEPSRASVNPILS